MRSDGRTWTLATIGLAVAALLGYALFSYGLAVASEHLTRRVREQAFSSLIRHSIGWFEDLNHSSVVLSNTLEQDARKLSRAVGPAMTDKLRVLVSIGKATHVFVYICPFNVSLQ